MESANTTHRSGLPAALNDDECLWPSREDQRPEVVHTAEEFLEVLLFEPHLDRVVVLPNGVELLHQVGSIPGALSSALQSATSVRQLIHALSSESKAKLKGRLWHYGNSTEQEVVQTTAERCLSSLETALQVDGAVPDGTPLYLTEVKWVHPVTHPSAPQEHVSTTTEVDIYDITSLARYTPFWERSAGGLFIGERGAGSGLHVDQCLWSNVGRNWCGQKQFAIWSWEERHHILEEAGQGAVFQMPLTEAHTRLLGRAKVVALVRPGDVWVFSGGQPHTAACAGEALNVSAYESLVPLHREAMQLLLRSNTKDGHWKGCMMEDGDLEELFEDVVDRMHAAQRAAGKAHAACGEGSEAARVHARVLTRLTQCGEAMREHGNAYCRSLWEAEDRGERYRAREESSSGEESDSDESEDGGADTDGVHRAPDKSHFVVDNSLLQSETLGLGYRRSARLQHTSTQFAAWGTIIEGVGLENGGWVKLGHKRYLPMTLKGEAVLLPCVSAEVHS